MVLDMTKVVRLRIGDILKERGITTAQFAEMAHITQFTARMLIKGYSNGVELETIGKVCAALGVEPGDLFIYEDDVLS